MIVLELGHDRQVFISNMVRWALESYQSCSFQLSSLFKRAATFGECSLLGKVFTPVALVTVLVVD